MAFCCHCCTCCSYPLQFFASLIVLIAVLGTVLRPEITFEYDRALVTLSIRVTLPRLLPFFNIPLDFILWAGA